MKIGYLVKYFYPIQGGAETHILNLALKAAESGNEVHVFTSDRKGKQKIPKKEEEYLGIHIHRARMWFSLTGYLAFYPSLLWKVLSTDLDIIHVSGFGFIWHDFVLITKKLLSPKTRFMNTPHGPFMALKYNLVLRSMRFVYSQIQKIFLNWLYSAVLEVNTFQWQWIVGYGIAKSKIHFVPNGIPDKYIQAKIGKSEIESFRKKYNIESKTVIATVGRISEYKGLQHVVEILPELKNFRKDITYLVMGRDDGYLQTLKAEASRLHVRRSIVFIEDVSEEEKLIGLALSEIFIFPSEWEALGIVMLEAMSRGNALIATKTEGGKFMITEGINGFLFDYGDSKALLALITKLLSDKQLLDRFSKENLHRIKNYSWDKIYNERYLPVLQSLEAKN